MKEVKYLVMVTAQNNNKYYRMIPNGDTFDVEYGRIGATCQKTSYPMSQWNKKYTEKVKKGYVDQSDIAAEMVVKKTVKFADILSESVRKIVDRLQSMAKTAIRENYTITSNQVTQAMCDEAQTILDSMCDITNLNEFNRVLIKLFTTIPRKMAHVQDYLANDVSEFAKIIKREQDLLDVMQGQVKTNNTTTVDVDNDGQTTMLESMGIKIEECDADDIDIIKRHLGSNASKFKNAWRVVNVKTQKAFDEFTAKHNITEKKLLWHGSRNENWWSIINTGLMLKPTNAVITGKMFGYGIYFAPKAQKSMGYTSLSGSYWAKGSSNTGFMALMDVAYGKPYNVYSHDSSMYNLSYDKLQRIQHANCLHAHAGRMLRNDEIVVYKQEQVTIKYLVEITN